MESFLKKHHIFNSYILIFFEISESRMIQKIFGMGKNFFKLFLNCFITIRTIRFLVQILVMKLPLTIILLALVGFNLKAQESAIDLYNRGYRYLSVDKEKAIELLTRSLSLDSTLTDAYFHRGITYFKKDQFESALKDFEKAYDLNNDLAVLWMYKGFCQRNQGKLNEALESFSNYISLNPTDTSAYSYILRGKMKYELGDFDGAVEDYDMATKLKPFEEKYNYYIFLAYKEAGQFKLALKSVTELIKVNPDFYGYYFYKGNIYQDMKYYDSAVYMYNIAIIKNYQNPDSYFYRAQSYEHLKKYSKALEDYNTAITLNKNDGAFFSKRGNCKYLLEDKAGACEDWGQAGALGYYEDFDKVKELCE